jgi:hypothetical protein
LSRSVWICFVVSVSVLCTALADQPSAELIRALGSRDFAQREEASLALERFGDAALPALQEAEKNEDPEIRRRAGAITRKIEESQWAAKLLQPRKFRFRFKDRPLAEALRQIQAETGLQAVLDDAKLAERRVTVDTGELLLWDAWGAFCRAAGLTECGHAELALKLTAAPKPSSSFATMGPFRVRIYSAPDTARKASSGPWAATPLFVEIRAEQGIGSAVIREVRIAAIRETSGQFLPASKVFIASPLWQHGITGDQGLLLRQFVPALKQPGQVGEIHGEFRARVSSSRPLVAIDSVLKSVGKADGPPGGTRVQVTKAELLDDGDLILHAHIERLDLLPEPAQGQEIVRVRPGVVALRGPTDVALEMLELHDGQGRKVPRVQGATAHTVGKQNAAEFHLRFQPRPGETDALKLVLAGPREVSVLVPFVVKDVPLR